MKGGKHIEGAISTKQGKAGKLRVLVFPAEGGHPYHVDVQPEDGMFKLPKSDQRYAISPGSVWIEGGVARTCINSKNPQTVNLHTLRGDDIFSPTMLNAIVENNMVEQVQKYARTQAPWQQLKAIGVLALALVFGFLMFWLIRELGTGFEALQESINNLKIYVDQGGGSGPSGGGAQASDHQEIAPGGV